MILMLSQGRHWSTVCLVSDLCFPVSSAVKFEMMHSMLPPWPLQRGSFSGLLWMLPSEMHWHRFICGQNAHWSPSLQDGCKFQHGQISQLNTDMLTLAHQMLALNPQSIVL